MKTEIATFATITSKMYQNYINIQWRQADPSSVSDWEASSGGFAELAAKLGGFLLRKELIGPNAIGKFLKDGIHRVHNNVKRGMGCKRELLENNKGRQETFRGLKNMV